jgi:hypothetical protein
MGLPDFHVILGLRHVILSLSKDLGAAEQRSFDKLRMTSVHHPGSQGLFHTGPVRKLQASQRLTCVGSLRRTQAQPGCLP